MMEENIKDTGKTIECMVMELIHGEMEENTLVNIAWIKNMEEVHFTIQMGINIKECGKMDYKTD